jgi:hypothetical protein
LPTRTLLSQGESVHQLWRAIHGEQIDSVYVLKGAVEAGIGPTIMPLGLAHATLPLARRAADSARSSYQGAPAAPAADTASIERLASCWRRGLIHGLYADARQPASSPQGLPVYVAGD